MPLWAFRQLEDLKLVRHFVDWWIDNRQVAYGDFGGGISDDTDLLEQWPGLALMGVEPDSIRASHTRLADAAYKNGMFTDGLSTIAHRRAALLRGGHQLQLARPCTSTGATPRWSSG